MCVFIINYSLASCMHTLAVLYFLYFMAPWLYNILQDVHSAADNKLLLGLLAALRLSTHSTLNIKQTMYANFIPPSYAPHNTVPTVPM